MFDIAWTEMLVIAVVLIVVVGPKELPGMLRSFGKTTAKLRSMAGEFRKQFDEALKEAELDDLKKLADDARKLNPAADIKKALNPLEAAGKDVRAGLESAFNPPKAPEPPKPVAPAPAVTAPAVPGPAPVTAKPAAPAKPKAAPKPAPTKPASAKPASAKPTAKKAATPKKNTGGAAS